MRYAIVAASLALGAAANYGSNVTYTTEVVTSYETYCPGPTSIVHNQKTYTVTEATTLTITDCPCTVTKPVIPSPTVPGKSAVVPPPVETHPAPPAPSAETTTPPAGTAVPPPPPAETHVTSYPVPASPAPPAPTASAPSAAPVSPSAPAPSPFEGAGNKVAVSGLGLAALAGVAAFFL